MALLEKKKQQVNFIMRYGLLVTEDLNRMLGQGYTLYPASFIFGGSVEYCECFNQAGVDAAGF